MQLPSRLRRAAALIPLLLAGIVHGQTLPRSQEANLISVVPLGTSTVTEAPTNIRGNLLVGNDGNLYAISVGGGKGIGSIVRITPDGTMTVLHALDNNEGYDAYAGLMQGADGNFYGTTFHGGEKGGGVVFRMTPEGAYTVLRHLGQSRQDGYFAYGGVVQAPDGSLYGTTLRGGTNDKGTVFRLAPDGTFSLLHSFAGNDGENPEGTLVFGSDGLLYGTTMLGGTGSRGTIFKMTTDGTLTTLYSFPSLSAFNDNGQAVNATGANPRAALLLGADGNFYGTAYQGGTGGWGTVFRMTPAGAVTVVHAFTGPLAGAGYPLSNVTQGADGTLYGTSEVGGGLNRGTAWRITPAGQFSLLHAFTGGTFDGATPYAGLVLAAGGLYGATLTDTNLGLGTGAVFKLDLGTNGVLPVQISVSPAELTIGATATVTWSSPTATSCGASGAWTDTVGTSGTLTVTPANVGLFTYVLTCTDASAVVRSGYASLTVRSPPAQTVDGGEGGGALTVPVLLLLGALALRKKKF